MPIIDEKALSTITDKTLAYNPRAINGRLDLANQSSLFIEHTVDGEVIQQRPRDGYINATTLCKKARKQFNDYSRLASSSAFINELSTETGIPVSALIQSLIGGNNQKAQGTWVHPQVAIHLAQWLSPKFAVQVSKWVYEWARGNVSDFMPVHVQRYLLNRRKVPPECFSMLNEIYLNLLAPLEDNGYLLPDKMMPDISTGRMFSGFLRERGIDPDKFPTYEHEFIGGNRPTVYARLYPIRYLPTFREYFNRQWLPKQAKVYFEKKTL